MGTTTLPTDISFYGLTVVVEFATTTRSSAAIWRDFCPLVGQVWLRGAGGRERVTEEEGQVSI